MRTLLAIALGIWLSQTGLVSVDMRPGKLSVNFAPVMDKVHSFAANQKMEAAKKRGEASGGYSPEELVVVMKAFSKEMASSALHAI